MQAEVLAIDTDKQALIFRDGVTVSYDRIITTSGIDPIYDDSPVLASYDVQKIMQHAWKAGLQTQITTDKYKKRWHGDYECFSYAISLYSRALWTCLPDRALFKGAWQKYYADLIEYVTNSTIENFDIATLNIDSGLGWFSAFVLNVDPTTKSMNSGKINIDQRWSEFGILTYESKQG